jgi:hypothetical protein
MAVTAHTFTKFALSLATKKVDLTADTFKVMLLSAYTVGTTQDTAQFVSDVTGVGTEASGAGYTAGGYTLVSPTFTESGHVYTFTTATNPNWTSSTISAAYALFYDSTPGTAATNPVIAYWDFGGTSSSSAGVYTLTISGSGIYAYTGS